MAAEWLKDTVFYEIYPQSFMDSNGDGIGDINGIIRKLDYSKRLGCNALWINPCYDSPFKDAGYDVRDYKKVAPRYGTNEDLYHLFAEAHKKGIRVLLDLVPGHTSEEHPWFLESQKAAKNEYTDRFIWTDFCFQGTGICLPDLDHTLLGLRVRHLAHDDCSRSLCIYRHWSVFGDDPGILQDEIFQDIVFYKPFSVFRNDFYG